jgi:hypothetical protein
VTTVIENSEVKLLESLQKFESDKSDLFGVHFHLSNLKDRNKSEFQVKIAVNIINDFLRGQDDHLYLCSNSDIVVIFRDTQRELLDKIIYQLRYLFMDDPLAYERAGKVNQKFCSVYMLVYQWRDFVELCKEKASPYIEAAPVQKVEATSIDSMLASYHFTRIDKDLVDIDLRHLLRNHCVCAIVPDKGIKEIFHKIYISISHLRDLLEYDLNMVSNTLVYRYLVQRLDEKFMGLLKYHAKDIISGNTNISLSINTILSEDFDEFDILIKTYTTASVIIDIDLTDVFLDTSAFVYARDYLKSLNYKICLNGVDAYSFNQINRKELGFDLIKLTWDPDEEALNSDKLKLSVNKHGPSRVILIHSDEKESINFGQSLGISLFEGWHINKLLNRDSKIII